MTDQDLLLVAVTFIGVAGVGYMLGRRTAPDGKSDDGGGPRAEARREGRRGARPKAREKRDPNETIRPSDPRASDRSKVASGRSKVPSAGKQEAASGRSKVPSGKQEPAPASNRQEAISGKQEAAPASSQHEVDSGKQEVAQTNATPPPKPTKAPEEVDIPRLNFDQDEDDLDVTHVGSSGLDAAGERIIYQPPLQRIIHDPEAEVDEPAAASSTFLVHAVAQTDTGLRRKRNEDSLLVLESANLFVVADGMGGHRGGEVASKLAVSTMALAMSSGRFEGEPHEGVAPEASELARAIQMANAQILEAAAKKPDLEGMGTTVCAARFSPNKKRLYIGQVGDSRCYRLRDGVFTLMTADHTMADHGVTGPESSHLSRAVGIWPTVPIDIVFAVPQPGDVYLLCSDGLTKMLPDEIIGTVLRSEEDPKVAVERLVFFANSRGGKDNITVVLVRVVPPDWKPATAKSDGADGSKDAPPAEAPP